MKLSSLQRILTALSHREPDRVPYFLPLTLHGARELGLSIREYFAQPAYVAEGQWRLRRKYGHDAYYAFHYAAVEIEAFGGQTVFFEDGPPNAGAPVIARPEDIASLEPPKVRDSPALQRVLQTIAALKTRGGDEAPIIGVVMSPFSLPVMQMGFGPYLDLVHEAPVLFDRLMRVNEEFCADWANAQLQAGASAICYFDPVSSPTNVPRELFRRTGYPVARRTLARIPAPIAVHLASGRSAPILGDLAEAGVAAVGVSASEDLAALKALCRGRLGLLGNLNGIPMRRWSAAQAEAAVREAIAKAGPGGGFVLSDHHGEIPWQVPDEVLFAIAQAVEVWGQYPLRWVEDHAR